MEIQQLESDVVDKIAAGEVVERPSHLLKELLENSIDAGATEIEVEVSEGGKNLSVQDNGKGVIPEELPLVFARHATSKIRHSEDLWNLSTFGFRGEALASISSVCRLDFTSRRKGSDQAFHVHSEFGKISEVFESSMPEGTKVQIQDLFQNIPARLKFLKSDSAEVTQIKNVLKAMAMQYPFVQIRFKHKGQLIFLWKREDSLLERVKKVLDTSKLYECTYEYEGFKSHVIFSDPSNVVRVSRQIWTFVQNRWVQDKGLQAAVMEAYRSLLMHGQYPICYVSVTCPPDEVDVNIHPTKSQVKFVDNKKAFRVVHYALREAIEKAPWRPNSKPLENAVSAPVFDALQFEQPELQRTQFQMKSFEASLPTGPDRAKNTSSRSPSYTRPEPNQGPMPSMQDLQQAAELHVPSGNETPMGFWSKLQVVGQVDLTYIVAQGQDKMYLVDQHAAHERVAFERLMQGWKQGDLEVQSLLLPITVDLEESEVEALESVIADLQKMGVQIEREGPASVAISSLPSIIKERALVASLKKLASEINDKGGSFALETCIGDIFATMACHSVVRAGQALSSEEMQQLLKDMDEFPLSGFCPHGRSVSIDFPFSQLEKDFGRRV